MEGGLPKFFHDAKLVCHLSTRFVTVSKHPYQANREFTLSALRKLSTFDFTVTVSWALNAAWLFEKNLYDFLRADKKACYY